MSEWIVPAASSAVWPERSVHARVSFSPAVKNVIRPSASLSRRTTSSRAEGPSRNAAASSSGELGELGLELAVDPVRAVDDREQRLRREWVELGRKLARPLGERVARLEVREHRGQRLGLLAHGCIARLRLLLDPLEPLGDVIGVGDEQLELQLLEVALRIAPGENPSATASSASTWRSPPSRAGPVPGTS